MEDEKNVELDQNFEFNDGVGDALKEKERYSFSWPKTMAFLGVSLVGVIIITFGILKIGKVMFKISKSPTVIEFQEDIPISDDLTVDSYDEEIALDDGVDIQEVAVDTKKMKPKIVLKDNLEETIPQKVSIKIQKKSIISNRSVYKVIAGSFKQYSNAKKELSRLNKLGINGYIWTNNTNDGPLFKLQVGAFKKQSSAKKQLDLLNTKNISAYIIKN